MNADRPKLRLFNAASDCPAPEVLLSFHRGRLSSWRRNAVARHLDRCPACARDSQFVAGILNEENGLLQGIAALVPESRKRSPNGFRGIRRMAGIRAPRYAAAAAAGLAFVLFLIFSPGRESPAGPGKRINDARSGPAAGPAFSAYAFPKRNPFRDRPFRPGAIPDPDLGGRPSIFQEASHVAASFELSVKRERNDELYGWSLALYPETEPPARAIVWR